MHPRLLPHFTRNLLHAVVGIDFAGIEVPPRVDRDHVQRIEPAAVAPEVADAGGDLVVPPVHQPHDVVHVIGDKQAPAVLRQREAHGRAVAARFGRHLELAHELALLGEHLDAIGLPDRRRRRRFRRRISVTCPWKSL